MHFLDVVIRQAHPGGDVPAFESYYQKVRDAERYQREDGIEFPVLIDDLAGTTHQVYGELADPTYIIDADGRVALYNLWTHAPTLHTALEDLDVQGNRGTVLGGIHRTPHLLASMVDGWPGLKRGLPRSFLELELSAPGMGSMTWLLHQFRPVLAPIALRAKPLPVTAKLGLAAGAGLLVGLAALYFTRRKGNSANSSI
ncbi:MAG: hypothetical protein WKF34_08845 [Pyrinomonadaceae bacterium]